MIDEYEIGGEEVCPRSVAVGWWPYLLLAETGFGTGCSKSKGQTWPMEMVGMGLENLQLIPQSIKCYSRSLSVPEGTVPGFVQGISQEWVRLGTCGGCMETHYLLSNFALA